MSKKLNTLLKDFSLSATENPIISGLALDSRKVKKGDLFFALKNNDHIDHAIQNGAAAIIAEHPAPNKNIPIIVLDNLRNKIGIIAAAFYEHPSHAMKIVGITGTNGKTSCSQFIAQILEMSGLSSSVIGTLGNGKPGHLTTGTHTTPDAIELQKLLAQFAQQQIDHLAMEVSSHGIDQGRISGTQLAIAVFTNLTRDHLDYHQTMEHYAKTKRQLFNHPGLRYGVLNADDIYGKQWLNELHPRLPVYAYSINPRPAISIDIPLVKAERIQLSDSGITAELITPWGEGVLRTSLLGKFNLSNLLAVVTTLGIMGLKLTDILNHIAHLQGVPGRMQTIGGHSQQPLVVIDYAHTPDALAKALQALREHCRGELWCVFGCGGDRDKGKRSEMGKIASQFADQIIITDDNPRTENPTEITAEIRDGVLDSVSVIIEHDRRRAIAHAIDCADANDIILIAGKGHETYQIIGDEKIPFSDLLEAKMLLANL